MSPLWLATLTLLALVGLPDGGDGAPGASVLERSAPPGKKIVRYGDELFMVDVDDSSSNSQDHGYRHVVAERSTDEQHRRVVRVGDELFYVKDDEDKSDGHDAKVIHKRSAIRDEAYRWTDKTVPYTFDDSFGPKAKALVRKAMDEWSSHTCVKFRPARSSNKNKVKITNGDGCYSFVGMVDGTQLLSLSSDGCRDHETILHELGHALGMYHTQTRADRDKFVKVDLSDVPKSEHDQFEMNSWEKAHHYGVDYDYKSIMHYDETSFTSNGGKSIKTLNPKWQKIIGTVEHLSFGDIEMMNKMYKCAPKSCKLKDKDCPGVSFVDQSCKCVCPGPSSDNPIVPCSGSPPSGTNSGKETKTKDNGPSSTTVSPDSKTTRTNGKGSSTSSEEDNWGSGDGDEWSSWSHGDGEYDHGYYGNGDQSWEDQF